MILSDQIPDAFLRGLLLAPIALLWAIMLVRIVGLRSLSKMTSFDFLMTIASGSLIAGAAQASRWTEFGQALLALFALFLIQYLMARFRHASSAFERFIQNEPVVLMRNGRFIDAALRKTRVQTADVYAKLREANALDLNKVQAVILETTGDISILYGPEKPAEMLMHDVRDIG
ncbi:MAG: DUF421 domain-containing protein [Sphingobium sp.]